MHTNDTVDRSGGPSHRDSPLNVAPTPESDNRHGFTADRNDADDRDEAQALNETELSGLLSAREAAAWLGLSLTEFGGILGLRGGPIWAVTIGTAVMIPIGPLWDWLENQFEWGGDES